jgi:hypothetical protein
MNGMTRMVVPTISRQWMPIDGGGFAKMSLAGAGQKRSADEIQLGIFRRMTPAQRIDCAMRFTQFTLEFARATIRSQNPDWTPEQIEREIGRRITGIDVTRLDWNKAHAPRPAVGARVREASPG